MSGVWPSSNGKDWISTYYSNNPQKRHSSSGSSFYFVQTLSLLQLYNFSFLPWFISLPPSLPSLQEPSVIFLFSSCPALGRSAFSPQEGNNVSLRFAEVGKRSLFIHRSSPLRRGSSLFSRMSLASVPSSIRSSLVITPMVLIPTGGKHSPHKHIP